MHLIFSGMHYPVRKNFESGQAERDYRIREELWQSYENGQVLAFAGWLLEHTRVVPFFIVEKNSDLAAAVKRAGFEHREVAGGNGLLNHFGLWRWQKKIADLQIVFFGNGGKMWAERLAGMRKKSGACVSGLYYTPGDIDAGRLAGIRNCFCASDIVLSEIMGILREMKLEFVESVPHIFLPGMDMDEFMQARPWSPAENHFVFGMAESLLPDSGALEVVRAMAALWQKEDLPEWEVRMFGDGSGFEATLEEAQKLGVSSRLSLLSEQPLSEVASCCHAWLAPGYSARETPCTIWTALGACLPLICADSPLHRGWLPWAAEPCLFVPAGDPQAIAGAMIEIMKSESLRLDLAEKAKTCRPDLEMEKMSERLWALMRKLPGMGRE